MFAHVEVDLLLEVVIMGVAERADNEIGAYASLDRDIAHGVCERFIARIIGGGFPDLGFGSLHYLYTSGAGFEGILIDWLFSMSDEEIEKRH